MVATGVPAIAGSARRGDASATDDAVSTGATLTARIENTQEVRENKRCSHQRFTEDSTLSQRNEQARRRMAIGDGDNNRLGRRQCQRCHCAGHTQLTSIDNLKLRIVWPSERCHAPRQRIAIGVGSHQRAYKVSTSSTGHVPGIAVGVQICRR